MKIIRILLSVSVLAILASCQEVLKAQFPALYENIRVMLPDENTRRVGQSVAAASLPDIHG